jgi:ribosomal protein L37AE/L43A
MALCPSCGSPRLRNGYRTAPLPMRIVGFRTLLCDHCNCEFRAFSPLPPKSSRNKRPKRKADVFNDAPAVDLQALAQTGSAVAPERRTPAPVQFNPASLPGFPALPQTRPMGSLETGLPPDFEEPALPGAAVAKPFSLSSIADEDFTPPPVNSTADSNFQALRERISAPPPPVALEEPLMQLKENLEERRKSQAQYTCPSCGSHEVARSHRKFWERLVFGFTSIRPYRCERCTRKFRARRRSTKDASLATQQAAKLLKESCFNQAGQAGPNEGPVKP